MKAKEEAAERAIAAADDPAVEDSSEPGSSGKGPTGGGGRSCADGIAAV